MLLYPWFIAAYPVVALLGANLDEIGLASGLRPLLVSIGLLGLGLAAGRLIARDWAKAAALASLGFILFFSYGHVYTFVERLNATGFLIGRHRYLLPLWGLLFAAGAWWIMRAQEARRWTHALNLSAGLALAIPLASIAVHEVRSGLWQAAAASPSRACQLVLPQGQTPPDIYYFVLDGYMRDDILLEVSGFDNSPFLGALSQMGFVVARESQANYPSTGMSLSTTLNMDYLEALGWEDPWEQRDRSRALIVHSRLRSELECLGYTTIAFESGYLFTEWTDADYYLAPYSSALNRLVAGAGITEFENLLIDTTAGAALLDAEQALAAWFPQDFHLRGQEISERILFALENAPTAAAIPGPKLVFVHVNAAHPPFVFARDGDHVFVSSGDQPAPQAQPAIGHPFWAAYADQVVYMNGKVLESLSAILANSATPPVIIVQGDHGYVDNPPQARMLILNAYFLPGEGRQRIYPRISPVNTFRVVLDEYFGGEFGLLPDASYHRAGSSGRFEQLPTEWPGLQ